MSFISSFRSCVAIGIESANGCLPLFFKTVHEKNLFVAFMTEVLDLNEVTLPGSLSALNGGGRERRQSRSTAASVVLPV